MCTPIIVDTICGVPVAALKRDATPAEIAGLFCALSDDQMAEFFTTVKAISETWKSTYGGSSWQWEQAGKHMAECPGSCEHNAIEVVEGILNGYKWRRERMEREALMAAGT